MELTPQVISSPVLAEFQNNKGDHSRPPSCWQLQPGICALVTSGPHPGDRVLCDRSSSVKELLTAFLEPCRVLKAVPDARKFSSGLLGAFTPGAVREASTQLGAPRNSEGARVSVEPDSEA